jgi:hypothetical protein
VAAWAAAETGAPALDQALELLRKAIGATPIPYVVEQAWVVSALVAARRLTDVEIELEVARDRLLGSRIGGVLFPHQTAPGLMPQWRAHVGCFADQVYPIQALARLHASESDAEALTASQAAADAICRLQGDRGQWWWHYDAGRDSVVEGYPVYSVHQHAMAPMALLDLADAGGELDVQAVVKGLRWLQERPENDEPFIRWNLGVTWRKAARHDRRKLVRGARAVMTSRSLSIPAPGLDLLLRPTAIDRECRPYEFGWLLDTWLPGSRAGYLTETGTDD